MTQMTHINTLHVDIQNLSCPYVSTVGSQLFSCILYEKVQGGNDQEKADSEKESHSKTEVGKNKPTIRYLYHENTPYAE